MSQRLVQPGERVAVDARLIEIVNLSRLELEAAIPPQDIGAVHVGAPVRLTVDGSSDAVAAIVARINPSTSPGSRTVSAYLAVTAKPGQREPLRSGVFASGWIALDRKTALTLPVSALRNDQAQPYAIRVGADGRAEQARLALGSRGRRAQDDAELVEVLSGLAEGDRVLAGSAGLVPAGAMLRVTAPAPSPAATIPAAATPAASTGANGSGVPLPAGAVAVR